jgi:hypothetical protein
VNWQAMPTEHGQIRLANSHSAVRVSSRNESRRKFTGGAPDGHAEAIRARVDCRPERSRSRAVRGS